MTCILCGAEIEYYDEVYTSSSFGPVCFYCTDEFVYKALKEKEKETDKKE